MCSWVFSEANIATSNAYALLTNINIIHACMYAFAGVCHSYIVFYEKKRMCPYVSVGLSYVYTDVRQFLFSYLINTTTTLSHLLHPSACVGLPVKSQEGCCIIMTYTRLYRGHNSTREREREPIYIFIYKSSNRHNNVKLNTETNSGDSSGSP